MYINVYINSVDHQKDYEIKLYSNKGPVTLPTIVVLGQKVRSNLVVIVLFFVGPKKGHHRILRQKLKKRHLVLSLKNVILVLKKGKEFF